MELQRTYTPEENFRRVRRQKSLKFVVVEGSDDVPVYESCISSMSENLCDYDIIYSGGKVAIRNFLQEFQSDNLMCVIDNDFNDIGIDDGRLVSLNRYSIENYFICDNVISHSLQFALKCRHADVREVFNINDFIDEITDAVSELIKVLFYYQRHVVPNSKGEVKVAWSDKFLCQDKSWHLCRDKVLKLVDELVPEGVLMEEISTYFDDNAHLSGSVINDFPGKMLRFSLQRYIRDKLIDINPSLSGKYNDVESMSDSLCAVMFRSQELRQILLPVVNFLQEEVA